MFKEELNHIVNLYYMNFSEYNDALQRLADMIRGIGDPLVAIYARCYLSRVSLSRCCYMYFLLKQMALLFH